MGRVVGELLHDLADLQHVDYLCRMIQAATEDEGDQPPDRLLVVVSSVVVPSLTEASGSSWLVVARVDARFETAAFAIENPEFSQSDFLKAKLDGR